jgi:hypothetical protein
MKIPHLTQEEITERNKKKILAEPITSHPRGTRDNTP